MTQILSVAAVLPCRLDVHMAQAGVGLSRTRIQELIRGKRVCVNGKTVKISHPVRAGDTIAIEIPELPSKALIPQNIPLDIVYEDEALLMVNKPPGMVVHPAVGNWQDTLVNALLHRCENLSLMGGRERPGVVHRLDKNTSGIMVVAKTDQAHRYLSGQFKCHSIKRRYLAIVCGRVKKEGQIFLPIGRDTQDRKKISARTQKPRIAETHYTVLERMQGATLLAVYPMTGRTHQIRVHLASIGHGILGDTTYAGSKAQAFSIPIPRQMLHAESLGFLHPLTHLPMHGSVPPPSDMLTVFYELRKGNPEHLPLPLGLDTSFHTGAM